MIKRYLVSQDYALHNNGKILLEADHTFPQQHPIWLDDSVDIYVNKFT